MVQVTNRIEVPQAERRFPTSRVVIGAMLIAGLEAMIVARWLTGTGYQPAPFGLTDPGRLTAVGLPIAQFVHEMAGVAVVGLLFLRCFMVSPQADSVHRHLNGVATRWAWLWVGSTLLWIVLTISELTGLPVIELGSHLDVVGIVLGVNRILAELATLWVALAIALFAGRLTGRVGTGAALVLATAALLPSSLSGHAGHHNYTETAIVSLGVHLVAAAIWVGGLLALVVHLRGFPDQLRLAVPRFSAIALCCVVAVGISGLVESVVLLDGWAALWETERGHLVIAKAVALAVLVVIGFWHRQRTVGPAAAGRLLPLLQLAAGELLIMGATIGIAVVLSTTA